VSKKKQKLVEAAQPTLDEWKQLYDLAAKVKEIAPWDWMEEDDLFGFQMPGTGELGFISVMGAIGEHYSIAIYQGIEGLDGFWRMQDLGPKLTPEFVLQVPQLQLSFEDREIITTEDRAIMKTLGLKFRGANAWPQFRSYRPGCFPWYLEQAEAEMLICGLKQTLDVAPRVKVDPDILFPTEEEDDYLLRVNVKGTWKDDQIHIDIPYTKTIELHINLPLLDELKERMPGDASVEVDFFMLDEPIQENKKKRPFFPYMLMLAEHDSGFILGSELLKPLPSMEAMWEQIPAKVIENIANTLEPKEILVQNVLLKGLLQSIGDELGIKIKKVPRLTAINRAKREFNKFMSRF
jgi:Domain of unknown function (DUF6930)